MTTNPDPLDWHVAVYSMNEEKRLGGCLERVLAALAGRRALVTVIVNGSRDRSLDIARDFAGAGSPIEIFRITTGDKANAINHFIYSLRSPARYYGAVDGYAHIAAKSFVAMEDRLTADPRVVAVSGVCTNGRTMRRESLGALTLGGRLYGPLHAFRRDFLDRMVGRGLRLPLGLYSGDGLLGSMAAHDLDAVSEAWDSARIAGVAEAAFAIPALSPLRPSDLRRQFRRRIKQSRRKLQNAAVKELIYEKGYEGLPEHADDMVRQHLILHGTPKVGWRDRVFHSLALREIHRAPRTGAASLLPSRVLPA